MAEKPASTSPSPGRLPAALSERATLLLGSECRSQAAAASPVKPPPTTANSTSSGSACCPEWKSIVQGGSPHRGTPAEFGGNAVPIYVSPYGYDFCFSPERRRLKASSAVSRLCRFFQKSFHKSPTASSRDAIVLMVHASGSMVPFISSSAVTGVETVAPGWALAE